MDQQRFDELLQAELDGVITDAEAAELDEACEANRDFCIARDRDARLVTLLRSRGPEPAPRDLIATVMARIPTFVETPAGEPAFVAKDGMPDAEAEPAAATSLSIAEQDTVKISDETIREIAQVKAPAERKPAAEPAMPRPTPELEPQPVRRPEKVREAARPSIWTSLFATPLRWGFGMAVPAVVVFMLLEWGRQESEMGAGSGVGLRGGGGAPSSQIALAPTQDSPARPAQAAPTRGEFEIASAPTPRPEATFFGRIPEPAREAAPGPGLDRDLDPGSERAPDIDAQSPAIFTPPAALAPPAEPTLAQIEPRTIASALPGENRTLVDAFDGASEDASVGTSAGTSVRAPVRSDGSRVWSPPPAVSSDLIPDRAAEIPAEIQIAGLPENVAEAKAQTTAQSAAEARGDGSLPSEIPAPAEIDIAALSQLPAQTDLERALAETRSRAQARRTIARSSDPAAPANPASARRSVAPVGRPGIPGGSESLNLEIHLASARAQSGASRTTIPRSRSDLTIGSNGTRRSLSGGGSQARRSGANGALTARRISYLLIRHGTLLEDRPDEKDPTIQHIRARLTRAGYDAFLIDLREAGLADRATGTAKPSTSAKASAFVETPADEPADRSTKAGLPAEALAKAGWFAPGARSSSGGRAGVNPREEIVIRISVHTSP